MLICVKSDQSQARGVFGCGEAKTKESESYRLYNYEGKSFYDAIICHDSISYIHSYEM